MQAQYHRLQILNGRERKMSRHKYLPLAHFRKSGTGRLLLTSGTLHFLHFDLTLARRLDQTLAKFQSINLIQSFFGAYQMKTRRVLRGGLIRIRMSPMWWKTHLVAIWQILDSTAVSIFVDIYWLNWQILYLSIQPTYLQILRRPKCLYNAFAIVCGTIYRRGSLERKEDDIIKQLQRYFGEILKGNDEQLGLPFSKFSWLDKKTTSACVRLKNPDITNPTKFYNLDQKYYF